MPSSDAELQKQACEIFHEAKAAFLGDFAGDISKQELEEILARAEEYPEVKNPFWVGLTAKVLKRWSQPGTRRLQGPMVRLPGLISSSDGRRPGVWWKTARLQVLPGEDAGGQVANRFTYWLIYFVAFQGGTLASETPTQYRQRRQELADSLQTPIHKLRADPQLRQLNLIDLLELFVKQMEAQKAEQQSEDQETEELSENQATEEETKPLRPEVVVRHVLDQLRTARLPERQYESVEEKEPIDPYSQLALDGPSLADLLELLQDRLPDNLEDPQAPDQQDPKHLSQPAPASPHHSPQIRLLERKLCALLEDHLGNIPKNFLRIAFEASTANEVDPDNILRRYRRQSS